MNEELRAAIMIAYPNFEGLGEWEPALLICENHYNWENVNTNQIDVFLSLYKYLDPKDSSIWWAGKEFQREKLLNTYTGKN